ncbi:hypothetical protein A2291_04120 [candidate division WOR-1 bacterium RIFOXYB2_FULL_42_35]|uniref:Type II secretion system protein GspF domain-containing protein n=1 Tax=candidate division WOR-1 bacterium RIFOXYC2_FULL_41_25 TaxID=1802586 RepID=A0A1F4TN67_UNCSA|nr:MAG: hypothetical protein A2247_00960 [candidate division WOR-1 bacterium RIFOXYA2_FULL_41_14]OGC24317.1 MAG: hypothetical protein A2291_04120 [candidate division WOR-1 bacterium RIFOXYB2_FULL_42_35]OGC34019.1 MAG: hypothetical protein A2462_01525 [candidate division WOR-1 bacterium RIFOXYC2_FULL_41_25]OGC43178.1 MAG: hypothetical protein A2548_03740 [candidate division WOR-1 bacterium RIFOXYD2_FULL_41_8]
MTNFTYKARDKQGNMTTATVEAENEKSLARRLAAQGFTPVSITVDAPQQTVEGWFASRSKVKPQELIVFTRQLSSVLGAGVPLVDGLAAMHEQIKSLKFQEVVGNVKKDIEEGQSFSNALEKHPNIIPDMVVQMVRAGERAGILEEVLDRVSNLLEKDLDTKNKIKAATRYPIIIVATLAIAFSILVTFVIPRFAELFSGFNVQLPLPTRILIWINYFVSHYGYWLLASIVLTVFGFKRFISNPKGRLIYDSFVLKTPIFGQLFTKIYISRFAIMLSSMLRSGIPILDALSISAATVENTLISNTIMDMREKVSQGKSLSQPMKECKIFPPIAISMVTIGEKSGTLETMLGKVAGYFEREADYTIANITPLLEPILIFGLAGIMLVFALAIFMPMWDLISVYQAH